MFVETTNIRAFQVRQKRLILYQDAPQPLRRNPCTNCTANFLTAENWKCPISGTIVLVRLLSPTEHVRFIHRRVILVEQRTLYKIESLLKGRSVLVEELWSDWSISCPSGVELPHGNYLLVAVNLTRQKASNCSAYRTSLPPCEKLTGGTIEPNVNVGSVATK